MFFEGAFAFAFIAFVSIICPCLVVDRQQGWNNAYSMWEWKANASRMYGHESQQRKREALP